MNPCDVTLFERGGLHFAVPRESVTAVLEDLRPEPLPWSASFVLGTVRHHDRALAVLDLIPFLEMGSAEESTGPSQHLMVVQSSAEAVGLIGNVLCESREINLDEMDPALLVLGQRAKGSVRGCVRVDQTPVIVLAPEGLFVGGRQQSGEESDETEPEPEHVLRERAVALSQARVETAESASEVGEVVVFPLAEEWCGIPAASVREVFRPKWITSVPAAPAFVTGVANMRGEIVAVLDLLSLRGGDPLSIDEADRHIVAVRHEGYDFGILCASSVEVVEMKASAVEAVPSTASPTAAAYALGMLKAGDRVVSLLDLSLILVTPALQRLMPGTAGEGQRVPSPPPDSTPPPEDKAVEEAEVAENLERIYRCLKSCESGPPPREIVDELRGATHSVKGLARVAGGREAEQTASHLEALVSTQVAPDAAVSSSLLDLLHSGYDAVQELLTKPSGAASADLSRTIDELKAATCEAAAASGAAAVAAAFPSLSPDLRDLLSRENAEAVLTASDEGLSVRVVTATIPATDFAACSETLRRALASVGSIIVSAGTPGHEDEEDYPWQFLLLTDRPASEVAGVLAEVATGVGVIDLSPGADGPEPVGDESEPESEDLREYRQMFLEMADDMIGQLNDALLDLGRNPADDEVVNAAFRAAHSMKGAAGSVLLADVEQVSHALEDVLGEAREGRFVLAAKHMEVLLRAGDAISDLIDAARQGRFRHETPSPILNELRELSAVPSAETASAEAPAEAPAAEPPATASAPQRIDLGEGIRVPMAKLDTLSNLSSELVTLQAAFDLHVANLEATASLVRELADSRAASSGGGGPAASVSEAGGNGGMASGEELLQQLTTSVDDLLQEADDTVATVAVTIDQLRSETLTIRMLPVASLFRTFDRTTREAARSLGKRVRFETAGGDTEIDKRVLEEVGEALMHLVRNAVDHGVESPEARRAAGKSEQGVVRLSARQEGSEVVFEISDDGSGIDHQRLRDKAVAQELHTRADVAAMTDREVEELVFAPGVSTAEEVSDLSGRGVGMDVVRTNVVDRLKGSIEILTSPERGTVFRLRVPLTLGIFPGLFVQVQDHLLCLPSAAVLEAVRIASADIRWTHGVSTIEHRGKQIPAMSLAGLLGLGGAEQAQPEWLCVLVAQHGDRRAGLVVDKLVAHRDVVVKSLGSLLARVPNVAAGTILGDGRISVILDGAGLMGTAERSGASIRLERPARSDQDARGKPQVLVVEDSAFTRELLRNILEVAGYEVITAADGVDGLAVLEAGQVDLAVVDVEMPRMDGIELTRTLRARPEFQTLPIVIVTARARDEERQLGLEAGADAYIVKGAFDQHNLVRTVGELVG